MFKKGLAICVGLCDTLKRTNVLSAEGGGFYGRVKTTLAGGEASLPKLRALPARKSSSGWQCETKVSVLRSYHCSDGKESETL